MLLAEGALGPVWARGSVGKNKALVALVGPTSGTDESLLVNLKNPNVIVGVTGLSKEFAVGYAGDN